MKHRIGSLRNESAEELPGCGGGAGGSDSNSCAENPFQSQLETFLVLTKPGFMLEERMRPLRETFLGDRIKASVSCLSEFP